MESENTHTSPPHAGIMPVIVFMLSGGKEPADRQQQVNKLKVKTIPQR